MEDQLFVWEEKKLKDGVALFEIILLLTAFWGVDTEKMWRWKMDVTTEEQPKLRKTNQ